MCKHCLFNEMARLTGMSTSLLLQMPFVRQCHPLSSAEPTIRLAVNEIPILGILANKARMNGAKK
jgi:hypothetical protein